MLPSKRQGLTLVELLVIIGIVAIAIGLLLPATRRVQEPANRSTCSNNLSQLIKAMHNYHISGGPRPIPDADYPEGNDEHGFPRGCVGKGATPEERLSWMTALLPYLELENTHARLDFTQGYAANHPVTQVQIKQFQCPSANMPEPAGPITHYVAMSGLGLDAAQRPAGAEGIGFMGYDRLTTFASIKDNSSNTIALIETRADLGPWSRGGTSTVRGFDPTSQRLFGKNGQFSGHPASSLIACVDGSVRAIPTGTDPKILAAAITIAGREPNVDLD